jgi:hypothetical protein
VDICAYDTSTNRGSNLASFIKISKSGDGGGILHTLAIPTALQTKDYNVNATDSQLMNVKEISTKIRSSTI